MNGHDRHGSHFAGPVVIVAEDPATGDQYRQIIEAAGLRASDACRLEDGSDRLKQQLNASAILVHLTSQAEISGSAMVQIEAFCAAHDLPLILIFDITLLDDILGTIKYSGVEHIVINEKGVEKTDVPAEIIIALPRQIQRSRTVVFSSRDEIDIVDLKKISADVERIAKALNELSVPASGNIQRDPIGRGPFESDPASSVSDAPVSFKAQDPADTQAYGFAANQSGQLPATEASGRVTASQVRDLIRARRLRDQYFDAELFADPAWDMLLDLMAAQLEGTRVSVSSLCIAASVPPTTALRWIKTMTEEEIFVRQADERDGRRIFIELSDEATAGMIGFFSMIRRSNLMMV